MFYITSDNYGTCPMPFNNLTAAKLQCMQMLKYSNDHGNLHIFRANSLTPKVVETITATGESIPADNGIVKLNKQDWEISIQRGKVNYQAV